MSRRLWRTDGDFVVVTEDRRRHRLVTGARRESHDLKHRRAGERHLRPRTRDVGQHPTALLAKKLVRAKAIWPGDCDTTRCSPKVRTASSGV